MWESIFLTLIATAGNNIGKVLQKKGTVILPPLSLKLKVIRAYIFNKIWILGFLMDVLGALLMLKALSDAPVSVIQPISGCGLAILSVFSHFYLKEVMNTLDWLGIVLAGLGTIAIGFGGEEDYASKLSLLGFPWLVFAITILFVLLNGWLRAYRRHRREQELLQFEVVEEIIIGLESGVLFGMASVISKIGFIFSRQGFSKAFVPICIAISIACSGTGFVYQTRGLKHGRAIVVSTCAAVASILTGVIGGILALGESLPTAPVARVSLLCGWFLIILGVIILVTSSRLLALMPRPLRGLVGSNLEKNHSIRRSGSVRSKETSPSAVIHASTLHHLISSKGKA